MWREVQILERYVAFLAGEARVRQQHLVVGVFIPFFSRVENQFDAKRRVQGSGRLRIVACEEERIEVPNFMNPANGLIENGGGNIAALNSYRRA
jgi:hypothetical protein